LLAAEMTAVMHRDPGELYQDLTKEFGDPAYERIDSPATLEQKAVLSKLTAQDVKATELAGESITSVITKSPSGNNPIGGVKVATENTWFAVRPSGTEDVYKLYAESFNGLDHLHEVQKQAQALIQRTFEDAHVTD
ncbi:MAG: phosphoglucomutase, alpha-D-glucose phosphate-specific, partial [Gemmatimonadota bacterium]|nr:phosphoglucomutase, alpha-D-glucose phosphate-specific [Gemmatimonadota bacterium]